MREVLCRTCEHCTAVYISNSEGNGTGVVICFEYPTLFSDRGLASTQYDGYFPNVVHCNRYKKMPSKSKKMDMLSKLQIADDAA